MRLSELTSIKQAKATHEGRAVEKLRAQGLLCKHLRVSIRTGMSILTNCIKRRVLLLRCELLYPNNDTLLVTRAATYAEERIYQAGHRYSKAEVLPPDLRQPGECTDDLFSISQPAACDCLMSTVDEINGRYGLGPVRFGSVPDWSMRREMMGQSYSTRLDQLWRIYSILLCIKWW